MHYKHCVAGCVVPVVPSESAAEAAPGGAEGVGTEGRATAGAAVGAAAPGSAAAFPAAEAAAAEYLVSAMSAAVNGAAVTEWTDGWGACVPWKVEATAEAGIGWGLRGRSVHAPACVRLRSADGGRAGRAGWPLARGRSGSCFTCRWLRIRRRRQCGAMPPSSRVLDSHHSAPQRTADESVGAAVVNGARVPHVRTRVCSWQRPRGSYE